MSLSLVKGRSHGSWNHDLKDNLFWYIALFFFEVLIDGLPTAWKI